MIWILGVIAALAAGVALIHLLLRTEQPRRKSRRPVYTHATAAPAASYDASPLDAFASSTYDAPTAASHSVDDSPSSCDTGSHTSFDSCDTGSGTSFDSGDCGSGGGSFD